MAIAFRVTALALFVVITFAASRAASAAISWLPWGAPLLGLISVAWVGLALATAQSVFGRRALGTMVRLALALLIVLATVEVGLRVLHSRDTVSYFVWRPNITALVRPTPGEFPGLGEEAVFSSNSEGLRGRERSSAERLQVLAVGGSTTESIYVDDAETWPEVARHDLAAAGIDAWFGNAGKSGTSTIEHLVMLRTLVPQIRPDVTLALVGVNDLLRPYTGDGPPAFGADGLLQYEYTPAQRDATVGPERLALYWEIRRLVQRVEINARSTRNVYDQFGPTLLAARAKRQAATKVDELPPDLDAQLRAYDGRLREMAALARAIPTRLVLLTQPSLYNGPIGPDEARVLSAGHYALPGERSDRHDPALGPERYFGERAMRELFRRYNEVTLRVCRDEQLACLDLASLVPADIGHLYDDVHFNRAGSALVGHEVAAFLRKQGLVP